MFGAKFLKFIKSVLKTIRQFLFKFFIILQCHYTQLLCIFLAHVFSTLDKRIISKFQFWQFQVFWWKFAISFSIFSSVSCKILLCYFFDQALNTLHKRNQSKSKFLRLLGSRVKIHEILVIFGTNQFFF